MGSSPDENKINFYIVSTTFLLIKLIKPRIDFRKTLQNTYKTHPFHPKPTPPDHLHHKHGGVSPPHTTKYKFTSVYHIEERYSL